jgi:hypothetical protein
MDTGAVSAHIGPMLPPCSNRKRLRASPTASPIEQDLSDYTRFVDGGSVIRLLSIYELSDPLNWGLRFSMNARVPSLPSSLAMQMAKASDLDLADRWPGPRSARC